ncbi:DUF6119 family protein [Parachryseolinea silvisoli]|uniref:DUF6119 family protein n=1 Tax=Parachryseolinea silvisoli TaxID=2873601 RepID=UPI002265B8FF|nr:DUF6119 family protein [Parachryseolinea silvisoli]MCD9017520.1 TIGR04141 family sporadically distributed protein [Parachryseolinea silvisoli]
MSEKIQIGIYAIKDEIRELVKHQPQTTVVDIPYLIALLKKKKFKEQLVNPNLSTEFTIHLFFKKTTTPILWKDFIGVVAKPGTDIVSRTKNSNESYVILFQNNRSNKIYAITGGYGHTALQGITENDFGLEILSRIIKADDKTIRSSREKNLTGGILGEIKFFRKDYNLNENENFGNFYQELQSALNPDHLKLFGFTQDDIDSDKLCIAKNSFTIKKTISFDQLLVIIKRCEELLATVAPVVEINGVKKLSKPEQILIVDLERSVITSCYEEYCERQPTCDVELCHRDFDKYLDAAKYTITFKYKGPEEVEIHDHPIKKIAVVVKFIRSKFLRLDLNEFIRVLGATIITSYDSDGNIMTTDKLENHYYTEIYHQQKSYFLHEKEWFEIKPGFISKLNAQCGDFIAKYLYRGDIDKWTNATDIEDTFNEKHIGKAKTIVLHKCTPENIEACDVLQWDDENVYLIHVKSGFDNSMRDLANQILISAKRINEDTKTGFVFLKLLFSSAKKYNGTDKYFLDVKKQLDNISEDQFLDIFATRKITLVLAVRDTAKKKRNLIDITSFESNIAKFSLSELIKNLRGMDVGFQVLDL